MSGLKVVALLLISAGAAGLVYGGNTSNKRTHDAKVGPFELAIKGRETINIPVWGGVGAIVAGGVLALCAQERVAVSRLAPERVRFLRPSQPPRNLRRSR